MFPLLVPPNSHCDGLCKNKIIDSDWLIASSWVALASSCSLWLALGHSAGSDYFRQIVELLFYSII